MLRKIPEAHGTPKVGTRQVIPGKLQKGKEKKTKQKTKSLSSRPQ